MKTIAHNLSYEQQLTLIIAQMQVCGVRCWLWLTRHHIVACAMLRMLALLTQGSPDASQALLDWPFCAEGHRLARWVANGVSRCGELRTSADLNSFALRANVFYVEIYNI